MITFFSGLVVGIILMFLHDKLGLGKMKDEEIHDLEQQLDHLYRKYILTNKDAEDKKLQCRRIKAILDDASTAKFNC